MSNCLGLYIEEHLIKYAKVSKDHDNVKVETFGVKFYDKINEAIKQIIEETYSQKTPVSLGITEEMYNYFDMYALLTKSDLEKAIKTEFEAFCSEKGYNPNVFETRYAIFDNQIDKEKIKIIHIAENKIELNKTVQQVEGYKVINASPISMSIPNLLNVQAGENSLIVNIEGKTTITKIVDSKVADVQIIDEGSTDFLTKINAKENSYAKAYELCKNTTIYTSQGLELQQEEQFGMGYLEDIMPTLFEIVSKIKNMLVGDTDKIAKVYITGTGALINNVDLYFQEYLSQVDCEILRPYFIQNTRDVSIKDYIEVNSAISLGMMGIGEGITGMNFKKVGLFDRLPEWLNLDLGSKTKKDKKEKQNKGGIFTWDLNQKLDKIEKSLLRTAMGFLILIIVYSTFSRLLTRQMDSKKNEMENSISQTNQQISLANADNDKINSKINEYTSLIKGMEEANDKIAERNKVRNAIPNLLNQIMSIIPENVQLTSIENTSGTHIVINAQSDKYEQLGYLKAKMKTDAILSNVVSTAGQKNSDVVIVKIEGDLP